MECPLENLEQNLPVKLKCVHVKNSRKYAREKLNVAGKFLKSSFFAEVFCILSLQNYIPSIFWFLFENTTLEKIYLPGFVPVKSYRTLEKNPKVTP